MAENDKKHNENNNEKGKKGLSLKQLIWRRFKRNKLAYASMYLLILLYIVVIMAEFFSPYGLAERDMKARYQPPQTIHFIDDEGNFYLRPFVYGMKSELDPNTFQKVYKENHDNKYFIQFFVKRDKPYSFFNIFKSKWKLFGVEHGRVHLFGTNDMGKDLFSLILYGGRVSLSIGLLGVSLSIIIGIIIGVISGLAGGVVDDFIQRIIELILVFPRIPLWMALSAALPPEWNTLQVYFGITVILSLIGWGSLARQLRGKVLSLREEEYIQAARAAGSSTWHIIITDLVPNCLSHIIVVATLSIPGMILGETALSFLGLGIRRPMVSWGVLLKAAQSVNVLVVYTWYIIPAFFVIATILLFNFLGDGIRDATDPFSA